MAGDQRARRGHADEDRAGPGADRRRGLLAERGVRLVADDDRVGVGDLARVADEPLVGLDRDRAGAGLSLSAEQRGRDALRVAAVAQLAVELVDEVAAVGEDQDAAGARGLDEAERGDRLAGAGGVLEPEALGGVGVLDVLDDLVVVLGRRRTSRAAPRRRLVLVAQLLGQVLLARDRRGARARAARRRRRRCERPLPLALRWDSASSAVSVPESASTWWAESTVPSTSAGSSWDSRRSRPSSSDQRRRQRVDGDLRALVELGQRRVERAPARRARGERDLRRPRPRAGTARGRTRRPARGRRKMEGVRPRGSLSQAQP